MNRSYFVLGSILLRYEPESGEFYWRGDGNSHLAGSRAGTTHKRGYRYLYIRGKAIKAHRLAWFIENQELPEVVDHINGDFGDNRISNLRACTQAQNVCNCRTRKDNSSGHRGVHWDARRQKWIAQINIDKKRTYLGAFREFSEAVKSRLQAEEKYFGDFAPSRGVLSGEKQC